MNKLGLKEINDLNQIRKSIINGEFTSDSVKTILVLCPQLMGYTNDKFKLLMEISNIIISELQNITTEDEKEKLFYSGKINKILNENINYVLVHRPIPMEFNHDTRFNWSDFYNDWSDFYKSYELNDSVTGNHYHSMSMGIPHTFELNEEMYKHPSHINYEKQLKDLDNTLEKIKKLQE